MPTFALARSETPLVADVWTGEKTAAALKPFDLDPDVVTKFYPWELPAELPESGTYGIGLIVGASGSGKSQLLSRIADPEFPEWEPGVALVEHFDTAEHAVEKFYAVGLNTVPVWRLPFEALSNGQQFRANLARQLEDGTVIDEFTSVVDRNVAMSASRAMRTYVDRNGLADIVLVSCHRDIIPWLRPDWIIDTDAGTLTVGETEAAPKWYAEHLTGDAVGRLTLKAPEQPAEMPAAALAVEVEPEAVEDTLLRLIDGKQTLSGLKALYFTFKSAWLPEHTAAAAARRAEIEAA